LDIRENAINYPVSRTTCGIIDSNENHLSFENYRSCPINYMKFYNTKEFEAIKNTLNSEDKLISASNAVLI